MKQVDLKSRKKELTKDKNKFNKVAANFFFKNRKDLDGLNLDKLANNEFYEEVFANIHKTQLSNAYFNLFSYTAFCFPNRYDEKNLPAMIENLEYIKETKLYPYVKELFDLLKPRALELLEEEKEIERLNVYFGKRNELQRALQSFRNDENRKALDEFIFSLEKWEEPKINYSNHTLIINGKQTKSSAMCGVKIGRGNRIHIMEVRVCFDDKENEYFIGVSNGTQWRRSDLSVIDIVDNIPDDVIAYFKQ